MAIFPGELTVLDDANRADGAAHAGAGATIWTDDKLAGGASDLVIASNALAVSGSDAGAISVDSFGDFLHVIDLRLTGSGFISYFWRMQSPTSGSWEAYWLLTSGGSWSVRKRVAGVTTLLASESTESLGDGDAIGIRVLGSLHEVYAKRGGLWDQDPVISVTDADISAAGPVYPNLDSTGTRIEAILQGDPTLPEPTEAVTLWVDPDHPAASDEYNRSEVTESTPLFSAQQGCMLAFATAADADEPFADTVKVKAAEVADPDNDDDPRMYKALDHDYLRNAEYPGGLPMGDNTGNVPIVVEGISVEGQQPILAKMNFRRLMNWEFENFQVGYDIDSGLDNANLSSLQACADLTFRDMLWTGGAMQVEGWHGTMLFEDCEAHAPLGSLLTTHNGRAFGFSGEPGAPGSGIEWGNVTLRRCLLKLVRGDDGIQIGMTVDPTQGIGPPGTVTEKGNVLIEDCTFWDVTEEGPGGNPLFHTDSVQILGVPYGVFRRNRYIGCSNALMASDYNNGKVVFEDNLFVGGGGAIQMQGTNEFICRHNSFFTPAGFAISDRTIIFFTRFPLEEMRLVMVNNIYGGVWSDNGPSNFSDDSVMAGNIGLASPGEDPMGLGANLAGLPEVGTSPRMSVIPDESIAYGELPTTYELGTSPVLSFGIGDGVDLTESDDGPITVDLLGRAFATPPDVGCLQSDPGTAVTPIPRPPYLLSRAPLAGAVNVDASTSVEAVLYPKPGEEIDPASVTTSTAYVTDQGGYTIPAVVSLSELDEDGQQTIVVDLKLAVDPVTDGELFPLATYTVHLTGGIEDSESSALSSTTWAFRVAGPAAPAIGDASPGPGAFLSAVASQRTTDGCVLTFNRAALEMNSIGMKTLRTLLDRLLIETAGTESDDSTPAVHIGPLT